MTGGQITAEGQIVTGGQTTAEGQILTDGRLGAEEQIVNGEQTTTAGQAVREGTGGQAIGEGFIRSAVFKSRKVIAEYSFTGRKYKTFPGSDGAGYFYRHVGG